MPVPLRVAAPNCELTPITAFMECSEAHLLTSYPRIENLKVCDIVKYSSLAEVSLQDGNLVGIVWAHRNYIVTER